MQNNNCNICAEIQCDYSHIDNIDYIESIKCGENILLETINFLVIPSFGPLHESHALIVTKQHRNNFAQLSNSEKIELSELLLNIKKAYQKNHKNDLIFFESGSGTISNHSGSCITHAHIHCLIYDEEFESKLLKELTMRPLDPLSELDSKHGYVWYLNPNNRAFYMNNPQLPSQFLRYLYSTSNGRNLKWNWRRHMNYELMHKVISAYK
ncbi:MAG: hypothetical protein CMO05_09085 [Thalassospira sp.]|nr:hypothetical protein [Thalassospira sp.]|tara:strand:- start:65 stop:694 length:630 start_codon:yes stop_codon:yes gene_type:complete